MSPSAKQRRNPCSGPSLIYPSTRISRSYFERAFDVPLDDNVVKYIIVIAVVVVVVHAMISLLKKKHCQFAGIQVKDKFETHF